MQVVAAGVTRLHLRAKLGHLMLMEAPALGKRGLSHAEVLGESAPYRH